MEKKSPEKKIDPENQEKNDLTIPTLNNKITKKENHTEVNFFLKKSESFTKNKHKFNNLPLLNSPTSIKDDKENFMNDYLNQESQKIPENSNFINVDVFLGESIHREIKFDILQEEFPNFSTSKISNKQYDNIISYAANTNNGIIRDYNEDRLSIIINLNKPENIIKKQWKKISYFAIFDGHGGNQCAEFLRNNLLNYIYKNNNFPNNIFESIKTGINMADTEYLTNYEKKIIDDNSGSCALLLLIIKNKIYIANVGDSRCIISMKNGNIKKDVTRDHKPNYPYEKERINNNGGEIYQTQTTIPNGEFYSGKILLGPYRVLPGRLSVSRTIGDAEAKLKNFGGNKNVIISNPDIYCFDLEKNDVDYVIMGCDGIFDNLGSKDIFNIVDMTIEKSKKFNKENIDGDNMNMHKTCGVIVDFILKAAMARKSLDNVSCIMVAFKDLINIDEKINSCKNDTKALNFSDKKKKNVLPSISLCNINYDYKNLGKDDEDLKQRRKSENDKNKKTKELNVINDNNNTIDNNNIIINSVKKNSDKKNNNYGNNAIKTDNNNIFKNKKRKIKLSLLTINNPEMETNNYNTIDSNFNRRCSNKFYIGSKNLYFPKNNHKSVPKNVFNTSTKLQNSNFYNINNNSRNNYNTKNPLTSHRVTVKNNLKNKIFILNFSNNIHNDMKKIKNTLERNHFSEYGFETKKKNQLEKYKLAYGSNEIDLIGGKRENFSLDKKILKNKEKNKCMIKKDRMPTKDIINCKKKEIKNSRKET